MCDIPLDEDIESNWENGEHIDQNGKLYKLVDMENVYIQNVINYFSGFDTSPLEKELSRRKNLGIFI